MISDDDKKSIEEVIVEINETIKSIDATLAKMAESIEFMSVKEML